MILYKLVKSFHRIFLSGLPSGFLTNEPEGNLILPRHRSGPCTQRCVP